MAVARPIPEFAPVTTATEAMRPTVSAAPPGRLTVLVVVVRRMT
jgi:hypothetical protein